MTREWKIGDAWPFESCRGLTGRPIRPVWHALVVPPQNEAKVAHRLTRAGVEVQYPVDTTIRHIAGKRREYTRPTISQIIYARFNFAPQWDVMRDRRVISGVFSRGETPIELTEDDVAKIMGLPTEAERLAQERADAMRPRVGEKAEIITGPLSGFFVDVTRVRAGRVWFDMVGGLGKGEVPESGIRRVEG